MTDRAPKPLVFCHIPKTAGSTVLRLLERNYLDGLAGAYGPGREALARELKGVEPGGEITCISGHQPMGSYSERFHHLIIFRDPLARVRSMYGFLREESRRGDDPQVKSARDNSLADYLAADPRGTLNAQVRYAAGAQDPVGNDDLTALEAAKARLSEPTVSIGVVDLLPESVFLAGRDLGWSRRYYVSHNVARGKGGARAPIAAEDMPRIEQVTELDRLLVDWARAGIRARLEALSAGERRELDRFRRRLRTLDRATRRLPRGRPTTILEARLP